MKDKNNLKGEISKLKIFIFLLLIPSIVSCKKEVNYEIEKDYFEMRRNGKDKRIYSFPMPEGSSILYYKGTPFNGILIDSDDPIYNAEFKEGRLYGTYEEYYENGQLKLKTVYKDSNVNGNYEEYYKNGQLKLKTVYKDSNANGNYEEYYENGQLKLKTIYKDGNLNGNYEKYYENGQIETKTNYKGGKKNGVFEDYYANGQLKNKGSYWFDNDDGIVEQYYENGTLLCKSKWIKGKAADGIVKSYYENGKLRDIKEIKDNTYRFIINYNRAGEIIWPYREYYSNGKIKFSVNDRWETSYFENGHYKGSKKMTFEDFNKNSKYKIFAINPGSRDILNNKKEVNLNKSSNGKENDITNENSFTPFNIKIKDGKNYINIRKEPISGSVIGKVSENEYYTVSAEYKSEKPIYLLNKKMILTDFESGEKFEKPKNFKLNNVMSVDDNTYYAEAVNIDKTTNKVYLQKTEVKISYNNWYYLKKLNGWIYSEFCVKLK